MTSPTVLHPAAPTAVWTSGPEVSELMSEALDLWMTAGRLWLAQMQTLAMLPASGLAHGMTIFEAGCHGLAGAADLCGLTVAQRLQAAGLAAPLLNDA